MGNASLDGGLYAARPLHPTRGMIWANTDRLFMSVCLVDDVWTDMNPPAAALSRSDVEDAFTVPLPAAAPAWTLDPTSPCSGAFTDGAFVATLPTGAPHVTGCNASTPWGGQIDFELSGKITFSASRPVVARMFLFYAAGYTFFVETSPDGGISLKASGIGTVGGTSLTPVAGSMWVCLRSRNGAISLFAIGSNAATPPRTGWTLIGVSPTALSGKLAPEQLTLQVFNESGSPLPGALTGTWSGVERLDPLDTFDNP